MNDDRRSLRVDIELGVRHPDFAGDVFVRSVESYFASTNAERTDDGVELEALSCTACDGTGNDRGEHGTCSICDGAGYLSQETRPFEVAGDVNRIKIMGYGDAASTTIELDGVRLENVYGLELSVHARRPENQIVARVVMDVYVDLVEIDGDTRVHSFSRQVAKLTDLEAVEHTLTLLGEHGADRLRDKLIDLVADLAKETK